MTQTLLLIHRGSDGVLTNMPFTYRDGNMLPVVEEIADYIVGVGAECAFWEGIAADRLRSILLLQQDKNAMKEVIAQQQRIIDLVKEKAGLGPLKEATV